jgi:hypothetical protein
MMMGLGPSSSLGRRWLDLMAYDISPAPLISLPLLNFPFLPLIPRSRKLLRLTNETWLLSGP